VRDVLAALDVVIEETGTQVVVDDLPVLAVHARLLSTAFQNLVANAIRFRRDEQPRVHIGAERRGDEWVVSVHDNGIGMDPGQLERIFQVFQRLHGPTEFPGTGMGLAICKKVVERHRGSIWAESAPGEGSTLFFTLPTGPPEESLPADGHDGP